MNFPPRPDIDGEQAPPWESGVRHPAFPNVPADQPVGRMDGPRFMQSYCDQTLLGMAKGMAGEPQHVVDMVIAILQKRGFELEPARPQVFARMPQVRPENRQRFPRRAKPLGPAPLIDGRESQQDFAQKLPRNPKERFQANIARFSKLSDPDLRSIAKKRTSPESKAARHVIAWRENQADKRPILLL